MKETAKLIIVLTIICFFAGLLLAAVHTVTRDPIERAKRLEKINALKKVLPEYDNDPLADKFVAGDCIFYVARKGGSFTGAALETRTSKGYGG